MLRSRCLSVALRHVQEDLFIGHDTFQTQNRRAGFIEFGILALIPADEFKGHFRDFILLEKCEDFSVSGLVLGANPVPESLLHR